MSGFLTLVAINLLCVLAYFIWLSISDAVTGIVLGQVNSTAVAKCKDGLGSFLGLVCGFSWGQEAAAWWKGIDLKSVRESWVGFGLGAAFAVFVPAIYWLVTQSAKLVARMSWLVALTARFIGWAVAGFALNGASIAATNTGQAKAKGIPSILAKLGLKLTPIRAEELGIKRLPPPASAALKQTWDAIALEHMRNGFEDRVAAEHDRLNPSEWFKWLSIVSHVASGTHLSYFECEPIRRLIFYGLLTQAGHEGANDILQAVEDRSGPEPSVSQIKDWYAWITTKDGG